MPQATLSGVLSQVHHSSETSGAIGKSGGQVHTKQVLTLRVDGKPAQIKLPSAPSLSEGERVTLIGHEKQGTFIGRAMRNDSTGAIYSPPTAPYFIMGALFIIVGVLTLMFVVGIIFIGVGAYNLYLGYLNTQAVGALSALARPASPTISAS